MQKHGFRREPVFPGKADVSSAAYNISEVMKLWMPAEETPSSPFLPISCRNVSTKNNWRRQLPDVYKRQFLQVPRCGGDAMTAAMERRINDFLAQRGCPARLIKEYGMSEVAGIVCVSYGDWEAGDVGRRCV